MDVIYGVPAGTKRAENVHSFDFNNGVLTLRDSLGGALQVPNIDPNTLQCIHNNLDERAGFIVSAPFNRPQEQGQQQQRGSSDLNPRLQEMANQDVSGSGGQQRRPQYAGDTGQGGNQGQQSTGGQQGQQGQGQTGQAGQGGQQNRQG